MKSDKYRNSYSDFFNAHLTCLLSSHLSMADFRKSTRLSSLKYGNSFLNINFLKVPCLILRYSMSSLRVRSTSCRALFLSINEKNSIRISQCAQKRNLDN